MVAAAGLSAHSIALMEPAAPILFAAPTGHAGDGDLLGRFTSGDERAFEALVGQHQDAAFSFARRLLGDVELARDAVQEAFLRAWRHARAFDGRRPFRAWLFSIVRNLAIDHLRRKRPQAGEDLLAQLPAAPAGPTPGEQDELRVRVATVLNELPGKYRELIVMREMDGMPAEEIAEIIGVDYGTTRWRLHKARELFRTAWKARFGEEA